MLKYLTIIFILFISQFFSSVTAYAVTRFYLPATATVTPIAPTPDAAWEDTSIIVRAMMSTVKLNNALSTVSFADADATLKDINFRQYISLPLTPGQVINGSAAYKGQCRGSETLATNNLFPTMGLRIIAADGTTVRKTIFNVSSGGVESTAGTLTNMGLVPGLGNAGNYTVVAGDRLVLEFGLGGDPDPGSTHSSSLRVGDSDAADLPENSTDTTDKNPWFEFSATLTFVKPTQNLMGIGQ
jgi:hypothetical protein